MFQFNWNLFSHDVLQSYAHVVNSVQSVVGLTIYCLLAVGFILHATSRIAAYAILVGKWRLNGSDTSDGDRKRELEGLRRSRFWWAYVTTEPRVLWVAEILTFSGVLWPVSYGIAFFRWILSIIARMFFLKEWFNDLYSVFTLSDRTLARSAEKKHM